MRGKTERFKASSAMSCKTKKIDDEKTKLYSIIENLERANLTPIIRSNAEQSCLSLVLRFFQIIRVLGRTRTDIFPIPLTKDLLTSNFTIPTFFHFLQIHSIPQKE